MWQTRISNYRPTYQKLTLRLDDEIIESSGGGVIDLQEVMDERYARLNQNNLFEGDRNEFRRIHANQMLLTSDRTRKVNIREIDGKDALDLVDHTPAYTYDLDGAITAAGVLADEIPVQYTAVAPDGSLSVDYVALTAHLWTAVRELSKRIVALERRDPPSSLG